MRMITTSSAVFHGGLAHICYFLYRHGFTCLVSSKDLMEPHTIHRCSSFYRNPWLPGWILTTTLILSVLVLIWICCATVATAVDQYVPAEVSSGLYSFEKVCCFIFVALSRIVTWRINTLHL